MDHCPVVPNFSSLLTSASSRSPSRISLLAPSTPSCSPRSDGSLIWKSRIVAISSATREYGSSLNTPYEPRSWPGRVLSGVLQNEPHLFLISAAEQLQMLVVDRGGAFDRMNLSTGSSDFCLHRRIAELKERECGIAVEDIVYMLIIYKFFEIRVCLVPKLAQCIYNGRLEILPSKDWELESIHTFEVLQMIKEHISSTVGLKTKASVRDSWAPTQIQRLHFRQVYAASIIYGYFLKSASIRQRLESSLMGPHFDDRAKTPPRGLPNGVLGLEEESLRGYVMGFEGDAMRRCAELRFKEGRNVMQKHCIGLFGESDRKMGLFGGGTDEVISTSFSSLKRLVLEAVAFGCFLWEAEEFVSSMYKLER